MKRDGVEDQKVILTVRFNNGDETTATVYGLDEGLKEYAYLSYLTIADDIDIKIRPMEDHELFNQAMDELTE